MGMRLPPDVERRVLELAGGAPAPRSSGPARALPAATSTVTLTVRVDGLSLRSEANAGGRRRDAIARKSRAKGAVREALAGLTPPPTAGRYTVKLTRVGGRRLDRHDNLPRSLKPVADVVADWLGVDDGDRTAVRWKYDQRPGYVPGVIITIRGS